MSFTGNEDHKIKLADAAELTARYRGTITGNSIKGGYISKAAVNQILNQTGCVGIRYYYGLDDSNEMELVIVGVNSNEDDIDDGLIMERAIKCPPHCGTDNDLNS